MNYRLFELLERDPGCVSPDVPDGFRLRQIVTPWQFSWGIFLVTVVPQGMKVDDVGEALSKPLARLLWSAERYPPSLPLALTDTSDVLVKHDYLDALESALRSRLACQKTDSFFLAEARESEGDFANGQFYWLAGYDRRLGLVEYISSDNYIYSGRSGLFGALASDLERLPEVDLSEPQAK